MFRHFLAQIPAPRPALQVRPHSSTDVCVQTVGALPCGCEPEAATRKRVGWPPTWIATLLAETIRAGICVPQSTHPPVFPTRGIPEPARKSHLLLPRSES